MNFFYTVPLVCLCYCCSFWSLLCGSFNFLSFFCVVLFTDLTKTEANSTIASSWILLTEQRSDFKSIPLITHSILTQKHNSHHHCIRIPALPPSNGTRYNLKLYKKVCWIELAKNLAVAVFSSKEEIDCTRLIFSIGQRSD